MTEEAMDQFPYDGYPWLTLGLTRAMLLNWLRSIEDRHLHDFPASDNKAALELVDLRRAITAAEQADMPTAMDIADQLWFFYRSKDRYELSSLCIKVSNLRYHLPELHVA